MMDDVRNRTLPTPGRAPGDLFAFGDQPIMVEWFMRGGRVRRLMTPPPASVAVVLISRMSYVLQTRAL